MRNIIVLAAVAIALLLIAPVIYWARAPVLIVVEPVFVSLYGENRIRSEVRRASFSLFRQVRPVLVTEDVSDDIIQFAITDVSSRPYCVIFPLRFASAARLYRQENPQIPVVILEGRQAQGANPAAFAIGGNVDDYFLFRTDIDGDFYRAGLAAAIINGDRDARIAVFLESAILFQAREAFLRAINDMESPAQPVFYTSIAAFSNDPEPSCVVISGVGFEYFDRHSGVPVIFFSWVNPELLPDDTVLVFNDSPWAQLTTAVRMVSSGMKSGQIRSEILYLGSRNVDREISRRLRNIE